MSNSYVVQVLCFAWAVMLAEASWLVTHVYSCMSLQRLKMAALCYADKFVTEQTDDVSEVLIEDSSTANMVHLSGGIFCTACDLPSHVKSFKFQHSTSVFCLELAS